MRKDSLMRMGQTPENAPEDLFPLDEFKENVKSKIRSFIFSLVGKI